MGPNVSERWTLVSDPDVPRPPVLQPAVLSQIVELVPNDNAHSADTVP
jgi:hypothetical protein